MRQFVFIFFSGILFTCSALSQKNIDFIQRKADSIAEKEILNYNELKYKLSVKSLEYDRVLILDSSTVIVQVNFGITGYKLRFLFNISDSSMSILSFGRKDFLKYFQEGYCKLTNMCNRIYSSDSVGFVLSDALLPECYALLFFNDKNSIGVYNRAFGSSDSGNIKNLLNSNIHRGKIYLYNTIFTKQNNFIVFKKGKLFIYDKNRYTQLKYYKYCIIDVVPVSILRKER